jgi:predicted ATPase
VEFRILGSVEVADDGVTKDLGGLRERTLLARLLLSAGQIVSADRLAVFSGGCTLEAAEAVCPDDSLSAAEIFETVTALVDRSLLTTEERCASMRYGSAAEPRLELAGLLAPFWMVRGHTGLGRRWLEGALARAPDRAGA